MILELNKVERELLMNLVDSRIGELHPEIRRTMDFNYRDNLKRELHCYQNLLTRLHESDTDSPVVSCSVRP